jgi:hypothetical protein
VGGWSMWDGTALDAETGFRDLSETGYLVVNLIIVAVHFVTLKTRGMSEKRLPGCLKEDVVKQRSRRMKERCCKETVWSREMDCMRKLSGFLRVSGDTSRKQMATERGWELLWRGLKLFMVLVVGRQGRDFRVKTTRYDLKKRKDTRKFTIRPPLSVLWGSYL